MPDFVARRSEIHTGWAVTAGIAGAFAYLVAQAFDILILRDKTDDLKLVGMVVTRRSPFWQLFGLTGHYGLGALLGIAYAMTFDRWLPLPPVWRGIVFTQIENTIGWFTLIRLADRVHPAIRGGHLPTYDRPIPFIQSVIRHLAYGAVLGLVYGDIGRKLRR